MADTWSTEEMQRKLLDESKKQTQLLQQILIELQKSKPPVNAVAQARLSADDLHSLRRKA